MYCRERDSMEHWSFLLVVTSGMSYCCDVAAFYIESNHSNLCFYGFSFFWCFIVIFILAFLFIYAMFTLSSIRSINNKTRKINVRQKVDQRAGQLSLPHVTDITKVGNR